MIWLCRDEKIKTEPPPAKKIVELTEVVGEPPVIEKKPSLKLSPAELEAGMLKLAGQMKGLDPSTATQQWLLRAPRLGEQECLRLGDLDESDWLLE